MLRAVLLALCVAACGDNLWGDSDGLPLATTEELVVVAHQDDFLFMQPDVIDAVRAGVGVTSVIVTDDEQGADRRNEGLRHAYGEAAGSTDWRCGWIDLLGHDVQHCRLADRNVALVFLGYPDGGKLGELDSSLLRLWEGRFATASSVGRRTEYGRVGLIDTVAQIVRETQPQRVRVLEVSATHGRDHSDHMLVGALAVLAVARANNRADILAYRGDGISFEPPNKLDAIYEALAPIVARYEALDETHAAWLRRRYAIGFRPFAAGQLRIGNQCAMLDATLGACAGAPVWRLDPAGELRSGDRCLTVGPDGAVVPDFCVGGPERRFFLDDEGHIWSGMPPAPEEDMSYAHLWCLAPVDGVVRAQLCGAGRAPAWELAATATETTRAQLGLLATGREVRLGDLTGDGKADLCAVELGALTCAPGNGAGGFEPAVRIDKASSPLSIDPRSLTLGDVDGDGPLDACGRNASGVSCATAASAFAATSWSASFDDATARPTTSASLTAIDADADGIAEVCGVDVTGVVCAASGLTPPLARSAWPASSAVVWPADLDGDRRADWCAATDAGPACAVEAERELTTDGAPWGYSQDGIVEIAPATTATVAVADIDGDGRADLCSPRDDRIVCARSQGRAFGPRATVLAILPNQSVASALWLGDLDGDGRADACADTGTTIACAVSP